MIDRKIYPLNPIFETTTRDGRRAWVAFYRQTGRKHCWHGANEGDPSQAWLSNGRYTTAIEHALDLTSVPPIPPEAREPQPFEVWYARSSPVPVLVLENERNGWCVVWAKDGAVSIERCRLTKPWLSIDAGSNHGYEEIIAAAEKARKK